MTVIVAVPCPGGDGDDDGVCNADDLCPNTITGAPVDADGCPSLAIPADFDNDRDVDGDDGDADQTDFATAQKCINGQNVPGDSNCAD